MPEVLQSEEGEEDGRTMRDKRGLLNLFYTFVPNKKQEGIYKAKFTTNKNSREVMSRKQKANNFRGEEAKSNLQASRCSMPRLNSE